ncbi:MAG: F0F1 ATP synthase subunit B [Kiritimatiellae bacterium]|nr:F0F1 ATP synthase subunit B [Kiritimatiellia bacterium]
MGPLTFDPGLVVWSVITFVCLLAVLARFAFRPLRKVLEDREKMIQDSLDKARRAQQEAERILGLNEERLNQAREEARRIIEEGHRIVAEMKREAQESARAEAAQIVDQARAEIEREVQQSLTQLKSTLANLAVRITRQVIRENIGREQHERLAEEFIERLKKTHVQRKL